MSKKTGLNELLCLIFKISFQALDFYEKENEKFEDWNKAKHDLNYRLNEAVFKYIGQRNYFGLEEFDQKQESQFVLDCISELIDQHFKRRCKIYSFTKRLGLPHQKIFILTSVVSVYFIEFIGVLKSFRNLGLRFESSDIRGSDPICLAMNFPSHSFSIPDSELSSNTTLSRPFSSFGEFLLDYETVNGKRKVFSVGEYIRHSRIAEDEGKTQNECLEKIVKTFPKVVINKSRSIAAFILDLRILLGRLIRHKFTFFRKAEAVLELKRLNKFTESIKYSELIARIEAMGKNIESIFILSFSTLGLLDYDSKVRDKVITYSYGDNFFIPPSQQIRGMKNLDVEFEVKAFLSEASLPALRLSGRVVGFTDVFYLLNTARKALNEKYGCNLPNGVMEDVKQRPTIIGYETEDSQIEIVNYKDIAVFDVPPEESEQQLSRALLGDRSCDFKFVKEFLLDIADAAFKSNCRILFKPKYSLSNYSVEYKVLIDSIKKRLLDQFLFISPYSRMEPMIEASELCLSFPYTSTKSIAEEFDKLSLYYVPECFRSEFEIICPNSNLLIGREELYKQLSMNGKC